MGIAAGTTLGGRYVLRSMIAVGGMGEVWRGEDIELARPVAIKTLKESSASNTVFLKRFRNEARNAAGLMHPTHAAAAGLVDAADVAPGTPGAAPSDDAAARRVAAKMRAVGADAAALRAPPADLAGFERWSEGFELLGCTARIEALLAEQARRRTAWRAIAWRSIA